MEKIPIRNSLPDRLDVADLEYDIKRMNAELEYHKSKSIIFEQTINAQQGELDKLREVKKDNFPNGEMYK